MRLADINIEPHPCSVNVCGRTDTHHHAQVRQLPSGRWRVTFQYWWLTRRHGWFYSYHRSYYRSENGARTRAADFEAATATP